MISLEVRCVAKNSRLEGDNIITDISFQPSTNQQTGASAGAQVGVPDANNLQNQAVSGYNLTSGVFTVNVQDPKEADQYQIGGSYQIGLTPSTRQAADKTSK